MPLTEQERRCVDLACAHLNEARGDLWAITNGPTLDEKYPSQPSPEVVVTNGTATAAIEVKRLAGDSDLNEYWESIISLRRSLIPSCGGRYILNPPLDFQIPIGRPLRKTLKREIERVSASMVVGDKEAVRVPRQASVKLLRASGQGHITCCHTSTGHVVESFSPRLPGVYFLDDEFQWEHSFITDQGREDFSRALAKACVAATRAGEGAPVPVGWYEEWELVRQDGGENGVRVATGVVGDVLATAEEAFEAMVDKARRKFADRRWAELQILVLEATISIISLGLAKQIVSGFDSEEMQHLDLILFVEEGKVSQIWPVRSSPANRDSSLRSE